MKRKYKSVKYTILEVIKVCEIKWNKNDNGKNNNGEKQNVTRNRFKIK